MLDTSEASNPTFAVYGDLGWENARSIPYLIKDAEEERIDGVLHCGDLAYDLNEVSTSRRYHYHENTHCKYFMHAN